MTVCMKWLPDTKSGQRLCGRPLGENHIPWTPDLGQEEPKQYSLCGEHLAEMIDLVETRLQRLQDELDSAIATEDSIFGVTDQPHDPAAHAQGRSGRLPGSRSQDRVRAAVSKLVWKDYEFPYAVVRQVLVDNDQRVSPTSRLTRVQENLFRKFCDEGKVDLSKGTPTRR